MNNVDERRLRLRNTQPAQDGLVVYWMQRDQRAEDNWALVYAQACALEAGQPLVVVFNLTPTFGDTTLRHYDFMGRGLAQTEQALAAKNIPFVLLQGAPTDTIVDFAATHKVGHVITDFNPLRFTDAWRSTVGEKLAVRLTEVDAHNIVPCWEASPKQEFAAYTFRPKITKALKEWLIDIPAIQKHPVTWTPSTAVNEVTQWDELMLHSTRDREVLPIDWLTPGTVAAKELARYFVEVQLDEYNTRRNNPNEDGVSNLSPYLHFGQLSPQWLAKLVHDTPAQRDGKEAYLEELIVRRELTDNYCFYNQAAYDQVEGAHAWAQKTISESANDVREHVYTRDEFETSCTHEELWNAMQAQLVTTGKLHGWCRMYWAKKILEWSSSTQEAIDTALYLNDKYNLDGTDPNGVVGVMWSIAGVHDRAWTKRPVFGKIRYMNLNGAKRKFDVAAYINRYRPTKTLFND